MQSRIEKLVRRITLKDLLAPFIFGLVLIPSWVYRFVNRVKKRELWLVAESGEARDNGYHFFKYVREKHPNDYCFFAVSSKSAGRRKVEKLGNCIKYGGLKHWLFYMSANLNISSQKAGNPSNLFWHFVHTTLGLYRNRVFLQHGVIMNTVVSLKYERSRFKYFVTSTNAEHDAISKYFGYPKEAVILTGLPRWDNLKNRESSKKSILIMPTWRNYLGVQDNTLFSHADFTKTNYYKTWNGFLNNKKFIDYIEKNDIDVYFYPHQHVQKRLSLFNTSSKKIKILSMDNDISDYLSKCSLMITDYSSVMFDFAFLRKPIVYYQFDREEFRSKHLKEGYFSYEKDGFGPVVNDFDSLFTSVKQSLGHGLNTKYKKRIDEFFEPNFVDGCSERIYNIIKREAKTNVGYKG